jgi:hypothetical protein
VKLYTTWIFQKNESSILATAMAAQNKGSNITTEKVCEILQI